MVLRAISTPEADSQLYLCRCEQCVARTEREITEKQLIDTRYPGHCGCLSRRVLPRAKVQ